MDELKVLIRHEQKLKMIEEGGHMFSVRTNDIEGLRDWLAGSTQDSNLVSILATKRSADFPQGFTEVLITFPHRSDAMLFKLRWA